MEYKNKKTELKEKENELNKIEENLINEIENELDLDVNNEDSSNSFEKSQDETSVSKPKKGKRKKKKKEPKEINSEVKVHWYQKKWAKFLYSIIEFIIMLPYRLVYYFFKLIYGCLNLLLVIGVIGVIMGITLSAKYLPLYQEASATAYEKLSTIDETDFRQFANTVIYDKNGKELGEINAGDYHYVDIKDCSEYIQYGYIATEDKRFMDHIGIDLQSLARAGISLVKHNGEITQGGSTITQQVIKNNVLSQEQTFSRKLIEVMLAPRLEQMFSKADIMEFYINTNYYGNGCYGIETASQYYFGKPSKDLSLGEAAMLCGVSNSPNKYNPVASMEFATQKKEQVLKNMLDEDYISKKQYKKALKEDIILSLQDDSYDNDNYMMSYAIYCTALELMREDGFEFRYIFSSSTEEQEYEKIFSELYTNKSALIRSGGYKIYTSFDTKLQKKLQSAIDKGMKNYTELQDNGKYALQSASVCVDNETGYVVAMVGGRGDKDEFNRAFLSKRQPGSCIKPLLVYAPAINEGIATAGSLYVDKAVYAIEGDTSSYSPKNSGGGYRGEMTVREALARSINTIAFQLYKQTSSKVAMEYLEKMHFTSLNYADNSAYSLCLGGFTEGVRAVDLAKGYSTLAMGGVYTDKTCLTKVEHELDGILYECENQYNNEIVYTEDTAFIMQDMMQGVAEEDYGTAKSIRSSDMIFGGKTGTTSSNKDAWFCGFSKYYTTVVWVGYDNPRTMVGMYGGTVPAKIWSSYMESVDKNTTRSDFEKPSTVTLRGMQYGKYTKDKIKLKYKSGKDRWYRLREPNTDWYSKLNQEVYEDTQIDLALQNAINEATVYLNSFENYYIDSIEDALQVDDLYNNVMSKIDIISDDYTAGQFRERASIRYETLTEIVSNNWQEYIDEYNEAQKLQEEEDRKLRDEDSKNLATEQLKQNRVNRASWYLTELGKRKYYSDTTKLLLQDALVIVERLKGYTEYESYMQWYNTEKSRVEKLPTKPERPTIPQDYTDNGGINKNQYEETLDKELEEQLRKEAEEKKRKEEEKKRKEEEKKRKEEEKKRKEEEKNQQDSTTDNEEEVEDTEEI